ncbi:MAG TPA: Fur family transcriptional regulator [Steroidobacteraceae bacterium]|nr:Fur family transcriptional regulator [Steroidobacteraceae bacterium]
MPQPSVPALASAASVIARLRSFDIIPTAQRVEIGQLLFACPQHLSAEQVLERLAGAGLRVSKATVYNTLNLFAARGLVRQINVDPERTCFDSNTGAHSHFHNIDTGELIDVDLPDLELSRLPALPPGTEIAGVEVVIRVKRKTG